MRRVSFKRHRFPPDISRHSIWLYAKFTLSQLTLARMGATPLADFGYGYNGVGNVTQIAELGQTRNFGYDDLQRLTAGGTLGSPESYAYDAEGSRTASHLSGAHLTDIANRLRAHLRIRSDRCGCSWYGFEDGGERAASAWIWFLNTSPCNTKSACSNSPEPVDLG